MKLLPFILLLSVSQVMTQAMAQQPPAPQIEAIACPNVRLDEGTGSMTHVAVRDQGSVPNCFAQVAAEIVDAWRFSHGDTNYAFQSSGLNLSFDYWGSIADDKPFTDPTNPNTGAGGHLTDALVVAQKEGVCNKSTTIEALSQETIKELFQNVQSTLEKEQKQAKLPSNKQTALSQDKTAQKFGQYVNKLDNDAIKSLHENAGDTPLPAASSLVAVLRDPNADSAVSDLLGQACDGKARLSVSYPKSKEFIAFREPVNVVENNLRSFLAKSNPQPIAISVCSQILYQSETFRGRTSDGGLTKECMGQLHEVIAVGARENKNKCQYLIRSSWGQSCVGFGAGWNCDEKTGSVWVDEDALVGNMSDYSTFEDQTNSVSTGSSGG